MIIIAGTLRFEKKIVSVIYVYLWNPATSCGRSVICIRFATAVPITPPRAVHVIICVKTSADGAI